MNKRFAIRFCAGSIATAAMVLSAFTAPAEAARNTDVDAASVVKMEKQNRDTGWGPV